MTPEIVYVLRTCNPDMTSYGGFRWPESGPVEAPDWDASPHCGNGLHGFFWGEGDGGLASWDENAKWLVVAVESSTIVDIGGKVKFPRGEVVFVGNRFDATQRIRALGARGAVVGITLTGGDRATLTGGYGATLSIRYYDRNAQRYRIAIAYVGENNIQPNVAYRLDDNGNYVQADQA